MIKVVFEPGCFDSFEGTQEELDYLVEEIKRLAETGELLKQATPASDGDDFDGTIDIRPPTLH